MRGGGEAKTEIGPGTARVHVDCLAFADRRQSGPSQRMLPIPWKGHRPGNPPDTVGETVADPKPIKRAAALIPIVIPALILAAIAFAVAAEAKGNLLKRAQRLETLMLNAAKGFSIKSYEIETGVYYRWRIKSDGREKYKLLAPELFRNSWINHVSIEDKEVKLYGLYAVEFDDEGEIDVWFMPIRPGSYEFYVEGLETQGFSGNFIVK